MQLYIMHQTTPMEHQCKLAAYDIPDSASLFGLSVPISFSLAYVNYSSPTVTTVPPYNDLIILLVCFCSECFLLLSRQQVSNQAAYRQWLMLELILKFALNCKYQYFAVAY